MAHSVIDRRINSRGKSTVNRKRFVDRISTKVRETVKKSIQNGNITDITKDKKEKVNVPKKDIDEPTFHHDNGGVVKRVHPGNKDFVTGDRIKRPEGGGSGGKGGKGSPDGEGEDDFEFTITNEEYMNIFYEDLELPNLEEKSIATSDSYTWKRAGYVTEGDPARLDLLKTMKGAVGRRISLGVKKKKKLRELKKELAELKIYVSKHDPYECQIEREKISKLELEIKELSKKIEKIPFIDEMDLRFRNRVKVPSPITQAVMFCVMDVSGSMDQWHKEMAKRFYMLLYIFLTRNYKKIDVVFVHHHTVAKEVNEEEFFYSKETGGTRVSPALDLTYNIAKERYPTSDWNIYVCQASDGDNWLEDNVETVNILEQKLLNIVQYFAYIEINNNREGDLWQPYLGVKANHPNKFAMERITDASNIFPVFRGLFKKSKSKS